MRLKLTTAFIAVYYFAFHATSWAQGTDIEKLDPNMALKKADTGGIVGLDPRMEPFRLVVFPWIGNDNVYRRLPLKPDWPIRETIDKLANQTAGGQIQFQSDSEKLRIRVTRMKTSGMIHMPATGQSGFDLYVGRGADQLYLSTTRFKPSQKEYEVTLFSGSKANRHFASSFPLDNGVESVEIGVMADAIVSPPLPYDYEGRIVVYGTSVTQGDMKITTDQFQNVVSYGVFRK